MSAQKMPKRPDRTLVILSGTPSAEEANLDEYREGSLYTFPNANGKPTETGLLHFKPASLICGKPIIEHAINAYEKLFSSIIIYGDRVTHEQILGERESIMYENGHPTLGDKLASLPAHEGRIYLAVSDLVPELSQLERFVAEAERNKSASFFTTPVQGKLLIERGFRRHKRDKIYKVRDEYGDWSRVAFPQFWAIKPKQFKLEELGETVNDLYRVREEGVSEKAIHILRKTIPRLTKTVNPKIHHRRVAGALGLFKAGRSSYRRVANFLSLFMHNPAPERIVFRTMPLYTLAADIDTEQERLVVESLHRSGRWGNGDK